MNPRTTRPLLIIGSARSVFVTRTSEYLRTVGFTVCVLDPDGDKPPHVKGRLAKLMHLVTRAVNLARGLSRMEPTHCAVLMSLPLDMLWLSALLRLRSRRIIGIAFGSDVLRRKKNRDMIFGAGLRQLDVVAATNSNVLQAIHDDFPSTKNRATRVIHFGLPVFDSLDRLIAEGVSSPEARRRLGFQPERMLVALGYSASHGQRQMALIEAVAANLPVLGDYDFVLPVQYGAPDVIASVETACIQLNAMLGEHRFWPLKQFHDLEESALMRLATTVLINYSSTDAFSGTVQETVYAGNVVLAADHLPYQGMPGFGTAIRTFSSLHTAVTSLNRDSFAGWLQIAREAALRNRTALHATSSWDAVLPDWNALLESGGTER